MRKYVTQPELTSRLQDSTNKAMLVDSLSFLPGLKGIERQGGCLVIPPEVLCEYYD